MQCGLKAFSYTSHSNSCRSAISFGIISLLFLLSSCNSAYTFYMKLKAAILLFCFCGLLTGTESMSMYVESFYTNNQTCSDTDTNSLKDTNDQSADNDSNEDSCCGCNYVGSVYLPQKGFSYSTLSSPAVDHPTQVTDHYSMAYLSGIWRPPADEINTPM